ncbi:MAG TPA: aminotransferase class V-fold PLP-dependent enzyme [Gemmatimonadaceae bacterium]|nr:aminotransferase class V-fold PLP-dependent enzyme [Gemmatimonadaceae bacterium]
MPNTLPANKRDFAGIDGLHYFYSGAEGPALLSQRAASLSYIDHKSMGQPGRDHHDVVMDSCRAQLGMMMGVDASNIAIVSNASEALHRLAESIPWRGDANVVSCDLEFPSVTLPLVSLRSAGVELRIVENHNWVVTVDDIARQVDENTQAIVVSHVSYKSGSRFDIAALAKVAQSVEALLIVDATQSLGVVPVEARSADYVIASTYKWLLGSHGAAAMYARDPLGSPVVPSHVGWRSVQDMFAADRFERFDLWPDARRWELGYPSFPSIYLLEQSLLYINRFDPKAIETHVHRLGTTLLEGARGLGMVPMTPDEPSLRAGNIAIRADEPVKLAEDLAERGVIAWGGDGRIRFSIHLFNDDDDVTAALAGLRELVPSHCS